MHRVFITVDVDWAPDWALRRLLQDLVSSGTRSTWFVTHQTPVLEDLRRHSDLVDLGIHPNFQAGSSHGESPSAILAECMRIVPEARTMRTHCLVQSTPILQTVVDETPIRLDTSVYLRDARSVKVSALPLAGGALTRVPYVWEDDLEFFAGDPLWDGGAFVAEREDPGELTVIDVHPIHYVLNSRSVAQYRELKRAVGDTRRVTETDAAAVANRDAGAMTFIAGVIRSAHHGNVDLSTPLITLAE